MPNKKKIVIVVGTRPNFIKITQFKKAALPGQEFIIVHTGQHFDANMAKVFFEQLGVLPDHYLEVENGTSVTQIADSLYKLDELMLELNPDLMIAVGDVNSTLVAALVASKNHIKLAHLESGLRSFDKKMPEEVNRILTDLIADYYFITEESGRINLIEEGVDENKIFFVGNTMIDTLVAFDKEIEKSKILEELDVKGKNYLLLTLHRPSNVDDAGQLNLIMRIIFRFAEKYKIVFPAHPRTIKMLNNFDLNRQIEQNENIILSPPLDYYSFQKLVSNAYAILTDSGGIQEEATFRKIPCLTLRENTERPVTIEMGTNLLVPFEYDEIADRITEIKNRKKADLKIPPKWDGNSTSRIVQIIDDLLN